MWRRGAITFSHVWPLVVLAVELITNKIRIPGHHIIFTLLFTCFYVLVCYIGQILNGDMAAYPKSFNFNCENDWSYFLNSTSHDVSELKG